MIVSKCKYKYLRLLIGAIIIAVDSSIKVKTAGDSQVTGAWWSQVQLQVFVCTRFMVLNYT